MKLHEEEIDSICHAIGVATSRAEQKIRWHEKNRNNDRIEMYKQRIDKWKKIERKLQKHVEESAKMQVQNTSTENQV